MELNKGNWKCLNCSRFVDARTPCFVDNNDTNKRSFPDVRLEPSDECENFINDNDDFIVDTSNENEIRVSYNALGKTFTGTVKRDILWDEATVKMAILKAKEQLLIEISRYEDQLNSEVENVADDTEDTNETVQTTKITSEELDIKMNNLVHDLHGLIEENKSSNSVNPEVEKMLDGETEIAWFERVTSWKRVLNAARRTIGKDQLSKEPSDSWKAKILLAEHSPIRLLEYDFGWKKIRQWVTAHFVRHHQGCEKFVHSQRGDRRELPCDRDHIYQGAKNDMDMTVNAQSFINISRKRCCMCASKETRDAWAMVLNELEKVDPVLRSKCVRECVYRGFCPEWMSNCKYCYSPAYWLELKNYRNNKYGTDEDWKTNEKMKLMVSSIGRIADLQGNIYEEKADRQGAYVTINNEKVYVRDIMDVTYGTGIFNYADGNKYNNALSNLV